MTNKHFFFILDWNLNLKTFEFLYVDGLCFSTMELHITDANVAPGCCFLLACLVFLFTLLHNLLE